MNSKSSVLFSTSRNLVMIVTSLSNSLLLSVPPSRLKKGIDKNIAASSAVFYLHLIAQNKLLTS